MQRPDTGDDGCWGRMWGTDKGKYIIISTHNILIIICFPFVCLGRKHSEILYYLVVT